MIFPLHLAYTHTAELNTRTITELNGVSTTYTLNRNGNPVKISEPLGKVTRLYHDSAF